MPAGSSRSMTRWPSTLAETKHGRVTDNATVNRSSVATAGAGTSAGGAGGGTISDAAPGAAADGVSVAAVATGGGAGWESAARAASETASAVGRRPTVLKYSTPAATATLAPISQRNVLVICRSLSNASLSSFCSEVG